VDSRRHDLISAAASIGLLVALAAGTFYMAEIADRYRGEPIGRVAGDLPDSFAEGVLLNRTRDNGEPLFRLAAQRIDYFRGDDSTLLQRPVLTSLDASQPVVTLTARTGRSSSGGGEILLLGDVRLLREASEREPALAITTDVAVLLPDSEIARSDRPVLVERGDDRLTGTGMEFNNSDRTLRVDAQVRALFTAGPRKP